MSYYFVAIHVCVLWLDILYPTPKIQKDLNGCIVSSIWCCGEECCIDGYASEQCGTSHGEQNIKYCNDITYNPHSCYIVALIER